MRVFVAGATGAIGRPLVGRLLEVGHDVTAMTRSPERAAALRAQGADAVVADALDPAAATRAVVAARPEVVVDQLTDLPARIDMRRYGRALEGTNRLRRETGPLFARAAREAGARRLIVQSVSFMLRPAGPPILDETAPLLPTTGPMGDSVAAVLALERAALHAEALEGVVLRYGFFYGPGTAYGPGGAFAEDALRRRMPVVGAGTGLTSFIHVDDGASATVAALDRGAPGVFHVTDDEPVTQREWATLLARAVGAAPPRRVPLWLARLAAGSVARTAVEGRGAANAKARRELGWAPAYPSIREGFPAVFGTAPPAAAPARVA
jgi:nucleoside-diphosphate-sugar epimerase